MNDETQLVKHYESLGYKDLGWLNTSDKAFNAASVSTKKQMHQIGRNIHLLACHDLKVFARVDSGD